MNTFTIFGCSYSYGAGLYYYEWLKDKPDGFRIPKEHDMWVEHSEKISSSELKQCELTCDYDQI